MRDIRADKKTPNEDDFKVLTVGIVCTIFITIGSLALPRFSERRDLFINHEWAGSTPPQEIKPKLE